MRPKPKLTTKKVILIVVLAITLWLGGCMALIVGLAALPDPTVDPAPAESSVIINEPSEPEVTSSEEGLDQSNPPEEPLAECDPLSKSDLAVYEDLAAIEGSNAKVPKGMILDLPEELHDFDATKIAAVEAHLKDDQVETALFATDDSAFPVFALNDAARRNFTVVSGKPGSPVGDYQESILESDEAGLVEDCLS
jgi:hypothetical protein